MKYYHGTVLEFANIICTKGIDVNINKGTELDFGKGFYFSDFATAKRLAKRKSRQMQEAGEIGSKIEPAIIELDVDIDGIKENGKYFKFGKKSREWLQFVFDTRSSMKETDYDLIEGPMADGAIDVIMKLYRRLPSAISKMIVYINFLMPSGSRHSQMVIKNQELCNQYIKTVIWKGGKNE